jgi:RNA polymerase sigma factor (sigma-70 family)
LNGYGKRMSDTEIAASVVAGDPGGLTKAYDRHADALFSYCRSMLREPADAAGVVRDTFVIAAARLSGLREPERLRAWLFAVARNECLRKPRPGKAAPPPGDGGGRPGQPGQPADAAGAAEPPGRPADAAGAAEPAAALALIRAAADGLDDDERDIIIQLWHGLTVPEVAAVLGVSRDHAYSLFSKARDQLVASVGVLLVSRSGRRDCPALGASLRDWDGRMTAPLRKRVGRHIGNCPVCSDRRQRELRPMLLSLSPSALAGMAAAPEAAAPGGLRAEVLRMATGTDPDAAAYRAALGSGHRPFGEDGFPRQPRVSHLGPLRMPRARLAAAAGTGTAAIAVAAVAALPIAGLHHSGSAGGSPATGSPGAPGASAGPPATRPGAARHAGTAQPAPGASSGGRLPSRAARTAPSGGARAASPAAGTSAPSRPTPALRATSGAPSQSAPGTLTVTPTSVMATPTGSITLTADGGPVAWSISEPAGLTGSVNVTPSSGTLAAGQSVTVTITASGLASAGERLTVNPGGQTVTVVLGLG